MEKNKVSLLQLHKGLLIVIGLLSTTAQKLNVTMSIFGKLLVVTLHKIGKL